MSNMYYKISLLKVIVGDNNFHQITTCIKINTTNIYMSNTTTKIKNTTPKKYKVIS